MTYNVEYGYEEDISMFAGHEATISPLKQENYTRIVHSLTLSHLFQAYHGGGDGEAYGADQTATTANLFDNTA